MSRSTSSELLLQLNGSLHVQMFICSSVCRTLASMLVLITDNQKCCLNLCPDSVCLYFTKEVFLLAIMALPTQNYYLYYFNGKNNTLMCSFVKVK